MARRNPGGRKKIEIKRIKTEEARQVCFSKRRMGLYKKACELCVLCGAEVAVVVYSPAGRAYSLGVPDVGMVVDRFLSPEGPTPSSSTIRPPTSYFSSCMGRGEDPAELQRLLKAEKHSRAALERALEAIGGGAGVGVDDMQLHELEAVERTIQGLLADVALRMSEIISDMAAAVPWGERALVDPSVAGICRRMLAGTCAPP